MAVENNFAPQPSKDQAIAELVKANADSLDVVYANALAHEALPARTELAISRCCASSRPSPSASASSRSSCCQPTSTSSSSSRS